jgi:FMN reductase
MTGGTPAHALALDYALRPVLMALGGPHVVEGLFLLDKQIAEGEGGVAVLDADGERQLAACALAFAAALHRPVPLR